MWKALVGAELPSSGVAPMVVISDGEIAALTKEMARKEVYRLHGFSSQELERNGLNVRSRKGICNFRPNPEDTSITRDGVYQERLFCIVDELKKLIESRACRVPSLDPLCRMMDSLLRGVLT